MELRRPETDVEWAIVTLLAIALAGYPALLAIEYATGALDLGPMDAVPALAALVVLAGATVAVFRSDDGPQLTTPEP